MITLDTQGEGNHLSDEEDNSVVRYVVLPFPSGTIIEITIAAKIAVNRNEV